MGACDSKPCTNSCQGKDPRHVNFNASGTGLESIDLVVAEEKMADPKAAKLAINALQVRSNAALACFFELDLPELQEQAALASSSSASSGRGGGGSNCSRHRKVFRSGSTYTGNWLAGARHGFGIQQWVDGTRYEGQWVASSAEGLGRFTFANGDVYVGQWRANMFNGLGAYRGHDNTVYLGCWVDDQRSGHGAEVGGNAQAGIRYAGCYEKVRKTVQGCVHGPMVENTTENGNLATSVATEFISVPLDAVSKVSGANRLDMESVIPYGRMGGRTAVSTRRTKLSVSDVITPQMGTKTLGSGTRASFKL